MGYLKPKNSIADLQRIVRETYGPGNERHYDVEGMLINVQRFTTRALKGIRKGDREKLIVNLMVSSSWFMSLLNQLDISLEKSVFDRFPYACSYCGQCPCVCKEKKIKSRRRTRRVRQSQSLTVRKLQEMFENIYPAKKRTLEHAGIHLAEEVGEFAEAVFRFRGRHTDEDLAHIKREAADVFSCFMGVCNSARISYAKEAESMFKDGCHVCHTKPCTCTYARALSFKS